MGTSTPDIEEKASARSVLERLEGCGSPSAVEVDLLVRHSLLLARHGHAERGRVLLERWRRGGFEDPDLALAALHLTVSVPTAAAVQRLRSSSCEDPMTSAMAVTACVFRGELKAAIKRARACGWFLEHIEATEALSYALLALALEDRVGEAQQILSAWQRRHADSSPRRAQLMLRFEARLSAFRHQYPRALALMEDAWALGERFGLEASRQFMEPNLASARAYCDDFEAAEAMAARWPEDSGAERSPIAGFRSRCRMEMALLQGRYDEAYRYGLRAHAFYAAMNNAAVACGSRFNLVLAAPRDRFEAELSAFRREVWRYQVPYYLRRLEILEGFAERGMAAVRDLSLVERSRRGQRPFPLARLWTPPVRLLAADVYWDRLRGVLMLRGEGPLDLSSHPVLFRVMQQLLAQPGFAIDIPVLFGAVWQGSYNPLVHEGKVHVTLHRLRRWLEERGEAPGSLLQVRDSVVGFDPSLDIRVVEPQDPIAPALAPRTSSRGVGPTLRDRVLQCLAEGATLPPRELERLLEVSRSSLNLALRCLQVEGRVQRVGRGRSTAYRRVD
jgi:hypothetical protein